MATPVEWFAGARPRTLPAAVAPVLAGTGVAAWFYEPVWWKATLALVVSLALQVGVNYANDYSDGIRGTDDDRVGPMRLVGSKRASAGAVKRAAFLSFGVAGVAGLVLAATTAWWLLGVGLVCVLAAWFYTGGSKPYGYLGLGEVMVFVFFGLVAVAGTAYVQVHRDEYFFGTFQKLSDAEMTRRFLDWENDWIAPAILAGTAIGALACAILVANNLRDIPTDTVAGKMTLAVRLGDTNTRRFYVLLTLLALGALIATAALTSWWALLGLFFLAPAIEGVRVVLSGATGPGLIPVLQKTGVAELLLGAGVFVGLLIA
jgi:1,4-dihydroxy-2-naphthoate octaprenyltransferase